MMNLKCTLVIALCATLIACGSTETRYGTAAVATPAPEKVQTRYARIEVVSVTLPIYADSEEIHMRDANGAITPLGPLWADVPGRALTLQISRDLEKITGRLVAPEPWPFRDPPNVRVDVRLEDFLATENGAFRVAGVVFTAPEGGGVDRARSFEIETPIADAGDPSAIAAARTAAISKLSDFIARNGLR